MAAGTEIYIAFWRDSARGLRFAFTSAWVAAPLMLFLLRIRLWTFLLLVAVIIFMMVIERFGYTVPVACLAIRAKIAGKLVKRRRSMFQKYLDG